jgi:O-antigen/teichoic acid export membrane protein
MTMTRRATVGRLVVGLADSGISSVGNLAVSIIAARSMSLTQFGLFATAMLVLILGTTASRSIHGDPLILRSRDKSDRPDRAAASSTTSVLQLSGAVGATFLAASCLIVLACRQWSWQTFLVLLVAASAFPLLCLQDHLRWVEYARGASYRSLINNAAWTVVSIAGLLAITALHPGGIPAYAALMAWGFGVMPAIVIAMWIGRSRLAPTWRSTWLRDNKPVARPLFLDFALTQATAQGATLIVASLSSTEAMALIRKTQIWLGPATVITTGILAALQPVIAQRARSVGQRQANKLALLSASMATVGFVTYGVFLLSVPTALADAVVGRGWQQARIFILPLILQAAASVSGGCLGLAIRAGGLVAEQVSWRLVLAPLAVVAVAGSTWLWGPAAGVWSIACSSAITASAWLLLLRLRRPA